jgi:hypothetical protein
MPVILQIVFYIVFFLGFILFFIKNFLFAFIILYTWLVSLIFVLFKDNIEKVLNKKVLSYEEVLEIKRLQWEAIWNNPEYLLIVSFWKEDFLKPYKSLKMHHKILDPAFLISISFYKAFSTRFKYANMLFLIRCIVGLTYFFNLYCLALLFIFYGVLLFTTSIAIFPPVVNYIKKTYGQNCIQKIGFDTLKVLSYNNKNLVKICCIAFICYVLGGLINILLSDYINYINFLRDQNAALTYLKDYRELRALYPDLDLKEPVFPNFNDEKYQKKVFYTLEEISSFLDSLISKI